MKPLVLELPVNGTDSIVKMTIDTEITDQINNIHTHSSEPDYTSMHEEIAKVADPVSFNEIKDFYNL